MYSRSRWSDTLYFGNVRYRELLQCIVGLIDGYILEIPWGSWRGFAQCTLCISSLSIYPSAHSERALLRKSAVYNFINNLKGFQILIWFYYVKHTAQLARGRCLQQQQQKHLGNFWLFQLSLIVNNVKKGLHTLQVTFHL